MGIGPHRTEVGTGKTAWLGSRHGVAEARPGTLDASAFAGAVGVEDGVVPSGYPVSEQNGLLVPFDGTASLVGFSLYDRSISTGDEPTAVVWHGRIRVAELPVDFDTGDVEGSAFTFDEKGV